MCANLSLLVRAHGIRHAEDGLARALGSRLSGHVLPMYWFRNVTNFGDLMSPEIVAHVSGAGPIHVDAGCSGKLLALGSLIRMPASRK